MRGGSSRDPVTAEMRAGPRPFSARADIYQKRDNQHARIIEAKSNKWGRLVSTRAADRHDCF